MAIYRELVLIESFVTKKIRRGFVRRAIESGVDSKEVAKAFQSLAAAVEKFQVCHLNSFPDGLLT